MLTTDAIRHNRHGRDPIAAESTAHEVVFVVNRFILQNTSLGRASSPVGLCLYRKWTQRFCKSPQGLHCRFRKLGVSVYGLFILTGPARSRLRVRAATIDGKQQSWRNAHTDTQTGICCETGEDLYSAHTKETEGRTPIADVHNVRSNTF
jgi:hypothetical protein